MLEQYCEIKDGNLVISIPIDALIHGVLCSEYASRAAEWGGEWRENYWRVLDSDILAHDLMHSLVAETEDGSSILSGALDSAFEHLNEYNFSEGLTTEDDV